MNKISLRFVWFISAVAVIAVLSGCGGPAMPKGFVSWPATSTVKIFPDVQPPESPIQEYRIKAVRNEYAPFQIAVHAVDDLESVSVEVGAITSGANVIAADNVEKLLVETVTIEKESMPTDRKIWPDPLPPYHDFAVTAGETRAVWIDLFIPENTVAGEYVVPVSISSSAGESMSIQVKLDIRDIAIPTIPTLSTAFGIGYSNILKAHKLEDGSPVAQKLKEDYYWFLVNHRLSPYFIPVDFYSEEAHIYLDDPRVTFLRSPFSWDKNEMQKIVDRLNETGWIKKAAIYMVDEPEPKEFVKLVKIGQWAHSFDPDFRVLVTHAYSVGLEDVGVQIWCPVIANTMSPSDVRNLQREIKRGKEMWWYTCIGPKWKGMNYFIDEAATAPRSHPWMNYLYDVTGILYWNTTSWSRAKYDPWETTMTYPGGNGDGSLLYPGNKVGYDGPVASIRLKLIREGLEDYELLKVLAGKLREAAGTIGADDFDPMGRLFEHSFALLTDEGRSSRMREKTPYLMFVSTDFNTIESERELVMKEIEEAAAAPVLLVETTPIDNGYTTNETASVKGFFADGASVTVNGVPADTRGNRFRAKVKLEKGENKITVTATSGKESRTITRTVNLQ